MNETKAPLYLIDAYGLIYRSYFAFLSRPLRNAQGRNISAVFGFFRSLVALLDQGAPGPDGKPLKPARLAAVFDSRVPTFRHERYDQYKANRQKTPEDLHDQVPLVEEALSALGVRALRADRYEADDLIATLAVRCKAEGRECYIVSADKDLLQLVGDGVYALRPGKSGPGTGAGAGGANLEFVGPAEVRIEWGVDPAKVLEVLALTGDASDNVPGVKGVGDKTATKLVARYGSLDEIYANIAGIEGAVGRKLAEGRESAYFSRELITLDQNAPAGVENLDDLGVQDLDRAAGARVLWNAGVRLVAQSLSAATVKELEAGGAAPSGGAAPAGDAGRAAPAAAASATSSAGADQAPDGAADGAKSARGAQGDLFAAQPEFAAPPRPAATEDLRGPGSYRTLTDTAELDGIIAAARKTGVLAFDFETDGLDAWNAKPFGFSIAVEPGKAAYVPVAPHGPDGCAFMDPAAARERLAAVFADPAMTVVAHNAKYDYEVSRAWGIPRWKCRVWDGMVAAWIVDPERSSYSLDALAVSWLGVETLAYDAVVPKGEVFSIVPIDTATLYAAQDADYALRVKKILEPCLVKSGTAGLFRDLEMPLLPILAEMEGAGIRVETGALKDYGTELVERLGNIEKEIYSLVGHEFNIASTKQLQEVLFVERKLKTGKKTKTGYSTDVGVLEELAREDPVPAKILAYRTLSKLKSTYVDALQELVGADGRLHTHFGQTGTATGRLSSKDPNLQNIPIRDEEGRRIRAAFVAPAGRVLVSADYSQIELVVLAHLSGDPGLLSAFKEGRDVHRRTASLIFGIAEDAVTSDQRRIAKTINFGVVYGMSAFRLSNELGISRTDAQAFIDAYFRTYAGVRRFVDQVVAEAEQTGYVETLRGRRRYIPSIRSANKTEKAAAERVAVNTPIQGSAADIVKLAMLRVDAALAASGLDARMLLQVHDELIVEASEQDADAVMELLRTEMEKTVTLKSPLRAGVEKARSWGDIH